MDGENVMQKGGSEEIEEKERRGKVKWRRVKRAEGIRVMG